MFTLLSVMRTSKTCTDSDVALRFGCNEQDKSYNRNVGTRATNKNKLIFFIALVPTLCSGFFFGELPHNLTVTLDSVQVLDVMVADSSGNSCVHRQLRFTQESRV